ncbi:phage major capsid protein [Methylobacterium sp. WL6]|uniref:phage major capsid protein n=1 Tax=Methylobacterium sp. WL6 TaxID=2603901 RepID=UPI0011C7239D|nr:phage major capsid protein [Methylobacterium sp. WL6]TXN71730.1 phage major capsid protein [Methylobacterium sp. WL6]
MNAHAHMIPHRDYRGGFRTKDAGGRGGDDDFTALAKQLETRNREFGEFAEKAAAETKKHGEALAETKSALEKARTDIEDLAARVLEAEQKGARRPGGEPEVKGLGERVTGSAEFKSFVGNGARGSHRIEVKMITSAPGSAGSLIAPDIQRQPIMLPHRPFTVRQLLQPGRTSGNLIYFVRQTGFVNNAAMVAEGAQKPESNITFAPDTAAVKTIAHWIPVTRQAFDDVLGMESMIDGELRYGLDYVEEQELLFGDGTGEHLKGLATQATAFAAPVGLTTDATAGSAADKIDTLLQGIVQAELALLPATGMILNTVDWAQIISAKDKNGQYLGNGPFGTLQGRSIWDLPTAITPAMPQGKFMVGSLGTSAQIFDRLDAEVVVSSEDRDNFIKNTLTVRAEKRLALAVKRPAGVIYGSFRSPQ